MRTRPPIPNDLNQTAPRDEQISQANSTNLQIRAAQLDQLYAQGQIGLIGALIGAVVLTVALWRQVPQFLLILWLTGYVLSCLPRQILLSSYKRSPPPPDQIGWWDNALTLSIFIGALFWGLGGVLLFPADSISHQFLLAVFITGISCGAAAGYWPRRLCYAPAILVELLPLSGRLIYQGNHDHVIMGIVIGMFSAVLLAMANSMHSMNLETLKSRIEKSDLAEFLQQAHDKLESKVAERTSELTRLNEKLRQEIEERLKVEAALRKSNEKMEAILNSTTDAVCLIDSNGIFLALNEKNARAFGKTRNELIGKPAFESLPPELAQSRKAMFEAVIQTRQPTVFEDERAERTFSHSLFPVFNEHGQVQHVAVFGREVTHTRQLEKSLTESEDKYRLLVEKALEGIVVTRDGLLHFGNDASLRIIGYDKEEILSKPFSDHIYPDDRGMVLERHFQRLGGENPPSRYSFRIIRKDGQIRWIEVDSGLISWEGKPAVLFFMSDITERKMAEESVLQEKQRFQRLVENSLYGMVIIQKGGKFSYMNPRFTEIVGYDLTEIPDGRAWLSRGFPDDDYRHKVTADWVDNFENVPPGHSDTRVYPVTCKDGREKIICFSTLHMDSGEDLITVEDVTLEHRAEQLLLERQEQLDLALEGGSLGTWDFEVPGGRGRIDERSAAILGMTLDEIDPNLTFWQTRLHPDDRPRVLEQLRLRMEGAADFHDYEYRVRTKSGEYRWVESRGKVTKRDENGKPLRVSGTFLDITDRKRQEFALIEARNQLETRVEQRTFELRQTNKLLEQEIEDRIRAERMLRKSHEELEHALVVTSRLQSRAEAANSAKSAFLANMSHELRTPLNAVIGFSGLLQDQWAGKLNEKQLGYVGEILVAGRHLLHLINDILDLSKVEAGKMVLETSQINAAQFLGECILLLRETAFKRQQALNLEVPDELVGTELRADPVKLRQILVNLLSNAVKFTPTGGRITLKVSRDQDEFLFSVSDTGMGIKLEDQSRIFEAFEQVDSSFSRREQGTGLGLALSRRLAELHGGRLWVESQGEGHGSAFTVSIPILQEDVAELGDMESATPSVQLDHAQDAIEGDAPVRLKVLVVEDHKASMELAANMLEARGYRVLKTASAEQGITIAQRELPALILMDISLPGMDGLAATRILKKNEATTHIPVIALTARAMKDDEPKALEAGCDAYLVKPVDSGVFYKTLSQVLNTSKEP